MKILSVHNHYQQRGGEDESTALEVALLRERGDTVVEYRAHNDSISEMSRVRAAARTVWSRAAYREIRQLIVTTRPDVMHVQNFFPLISPSAYYAARAEGVPVVQSLRNYRLLCPGALLLRDDRVCEACVGKRVPVPAVIHGCYRGSRAATAAVAGMIAVHHALGTWQRLVDVYVALTPFGRRKFIEGGLPAERIVVKPNFVAPDPGARTGDGSYALFVGRVSGEKGVMTLLQAWQQVSGILLRVVGTGPQLEEAQRFVAAHGLRETVEFTGRVSSAEIPALLAGARVLVIPSIWNEALGRVAIEAFAVGVPVIASRIGGLLDVIDDGVTGFHVTPGDATDLASKVERLLKDPLAARAMGLRGRQAYEASYSADSNYEQLMQIYCTALESGGRRRPFPSLPKAGRPTPVAQ